MVNVTYLIDQLLLKLNILPYDSCTSGPISGNVLNRGDLSKLSKVSNFENCWKSTSFAFHQNEKIGDIFINTIQNKYIFRSDIQIA